MQQQGLGTQGALSRVARVLLAILGGGMFAGLVGVVGVATGWLSIREASKGNELAAAGNDIAAEGIEVAGGTAELSGALTVQGDLSVTSAAPGDTVTLTASVHNAGQTNAAEVVITAFVDGTVVPCDFIPTDVPAGTTSVAQTCELILPATTGEVMIKAAASGDLVTGTPSELAVLTVGCPRAGATAAVGLTSMAEAADDWNAVLATSPWPEGCAALSPAVDLAMSQTSGGCTDILGIPASNVCFDASEAEPFIRVDLGGDAASVVPHIRQLLVLMFGGSAKELALQTAGEDSTCGSDTSVAITQTTNAEETLIILTATPCPTA